MKLFISSCNSSQAQRTIEPSFAFQRDSFPVTETNILSIRFCPALYKKSLAGLKDLSALGWGRVGGAVRKMVLHIEVVVDDTVIWFRIKGLSKNEN